VTRVLDNEAHHKLKVGKKSRNFVKHIYGLTSKLSDVKKNSVHHDSPVACYYFFKEEIF